MNNKRYVSGVVEERRKELEQTLLEIIKLYGDFKSAFNKDIDSVFNKNFPHTDLWNLEKACTDARFNFFSDVKIWELTNKPEIRSDLLSALGLDKNGNKLPPPVDRCWSCNEVGPCNCK
jgi:hypothetical protein